MMKILPLLLAAAAVFVARPLHAQTTSTVTTPSASSTTASELIMDPARKKRTDHWDNAVARFRTLETTAPRHGIVLLGDSITARWPSGMFPGDKINNRGIGSDHIGGWTFFGLLDRMDTSITALKPERVYLLIGVNDMLEGGPPMENMIAAYDRLLDELKSNAPGAEIYVHSILPVSRPEFVYMKKPILELNTHIKRLADEKGLHHIDLYPRFADENHDLKPELTTDGVHLSPAGYQLWLDVLKENNALPQTGS